jgi:hypothetical protein
MKNKKINYDKFGWDGGDFWLYMKRTKKSGDTPAEQKQKVKSKVQSADTIPLPDPESSTPRQI